MNRCVPFSSFVDDAFIFVDDAFILRYVAMN